jgi:general stress protein 26
MTKDELIQFIKTTNIGFLATVAADGAPRVRPVGIHTVYGDDLFFFTFANTRKVEELKANPEVEVVWARNDTLSQVRIKGKASIVDDQATCDRFKADEPIVSRLLPPGAESLFCLFRVSPQRVEVAEGLVPYQQVAWTQT